MDSSFTIMNPQHSAETAYAEWVIKAVELIAQSRCTVYQKEMDFVVSRQFALLVVERMGIRAQILSNPTGFFNDRHRIIIETKRGSEISEKWQFTFNSDVLPTAVRRSERRDLTLPRRLAVALRSLLSLLRLIRSEASDVVVREEREFDSPTTETAFVRTDIVSIPSSFGNLSLSYFSKHGVVGTVSPGTTRAHTPKVVTPVRLDENFMQTVRPHSLGSTIEMVIEVEPPVALSRSVPVSQSPPREVSEIWPTSSLSYPVSPGRKASFDSSDEVRCVVRVPFIGQEQDTVCEIFERPVPVSLISDQIDHMKRIRARLFIHR